MRLKSALLFIGILWIALFISCTQNKTRLEQPQNIAPNSTISSNTKSDIEGVLTVSGNFKPDYKVLKVRDVSTDEASRFVIDISLPKGFTKETLENNLRYAAKEQYEKTKADAIQVFGYPEGRSNDSSNSVGSLDFAPYGDWGRANEKPSLDKYKAVFKSKDPVSQDAEKEDDEMKKALAGDYQAQRNIAFYYSTGAESHSKDIVIGCAWYIVILKSRHIQIDSSDINNKKLYCDQQLNSQQLRQAEVEANSLLKKIINPK